jgi:multidrug resistance efflux pump
MMAKNPDERFQTPAEVAAALKSLLQVIEPAPASPPLQVKPDRKRTRFLPLTAIATLFIAALVAGVVFYLQTGNGTIRVELMDESLEATIKGEKIEVEGGDKAFEISAGRQQLVIRQKGSDIEFVTDKFRVWRNDEIKFDVRLIAGKVEVRKDGKHFDSKQAERSFSIGAAPTQEPGRPSIEGVSRAKGVRGTGKVVAFVPQERQQTVSSPVEGRVREISESMVEGGKVKQGEILLGIETHAAVLVAQLKANAKDLETKLATAKEKAEAFGENIIALEEAKVAALAAADESLDAAKARWDARERIVAGHKAKELQARLNHDRQKDLFDKGFASKKEIEKSQRDWDVAASELESAKLDARAAMDKVETRKRERVQKKRQADTKVNFARTMQQDALDQAATVQKAIRDIDLKLSELDRLVIEAPCDGTLFRLYELEQGQALKEGDKLFTIAPDTPERAVELWISGNDMPLVQRGDQVRLQFEGWPAVDGAGSSVVRWFGGEVVSIDPTSDGNGNFRILVKADGNDSWPDKRYLRPGVRANGWVLTRARADTKPDGN